MSEAYLLFGPEEGKKQDWIIEKKKEILSLHPDSEVVLLFTFETDAETLADALSSSSLFSSYKLVFLKNFDDVNYFAIEMGDDSMKNAGLIPHDILIFRKTKSAKENDIIICMVNSTEEVMIRRYTLQASRILLVPENDNIPSKVCKEITIYGILTKVIRNYE